MSVRRYSSFCNYPASKKNKQFKTRKSMKIKSVYQKGILGILAVLVILIGIKLFFSIPFMSLGLEEEKERVLYQNQGPGATPSSEKRVTNSLINHNIASPVQGIKENKIDSDRLIIQNKQIAGSDLNLKYQQKPKESIRTISGDLSSGESLYQYLVRNDISPSEILRLQEKVQSVVDIGYLKVGTKFCVHCTGEGKIVQFDYQPNQLDVYHISIPGTEIENIEVTKDEIFREIVCFEGKIESSLYEAMTDYCNSGQLAVQLAEIFAWDIDFLTECQPGDRFKILVEKLYRGDFYRWGDILAAVYEGEMLSTHSAVLFEDSSGNSDYYDEDGRCLRKAFLRAPLDYKYISSGYTQSRFHPILRIWRPHLAIDYAAPTGTPVVSIGSGTVISSYYDKGGYGNYIQVRHPNGYITGYGHLSKFTQGLKTGKRVEQGEIIGYVGATGLATGPHLDFSISKDGARINFLNLELPPARSVSPEYLEDFDLVKQNYLSILTS